MYFRINLVLEMIQSKGCVGDEDVTVNGLANT